MLKRIGNVIFFFNALISAGITIFLPYLLFSEGLDGFFLAGSFAIAFLLFAFTARYIFCGILLSENEKIFLKKGIFKKVGVWILVIFILALLYSIIFLNEKNSELRYKISSLESEFTSLEGELNNSDISHELELAGKDKKIQELYNQIYKSNNELAKTAQTLKQKLSDKKTSWRKLKIGMSKEEVRKILGEPTDINTNNIIGTVYERWSYDYTIPNTFLVNIGRLEFQNSKLSSIDEPN